MRRILTVLLALASLVAATAPADATPRAAGPHPTTGAAFPTVVGRGPDAVRVPSRPTRILSLSPSATQMLYAIGAGRQVVGVDEYSTWPPDAPRTKFSGAESSAEAYLPLHPDLVILAFDSNHLVAQLRTLHIPTLLLPPSATIAGAEAQVQQLGRATGHRAGAAATDRSMSADVARAVASARGAGRGASYYLELDTTYYSATSKTFIGALFSHFGMRDIADKAAKASSGYPQLSAEYVLAANPDYVFLADTVCCHQSPASFAARPGFQALRAVRRHHVVGLNDSVASEWGPHSLETFVTVIAHVLGGRRVPAAMS